MYVSFLSFGFLNDWLVCRSDISAAKTASTATFVTAIVFNTAVFAVELVIFTLIRPYFKAVYEPRTYAPRLECANFNYNLRSIRWLVSPRKRIQPLSPSTFAWPLALYRADYRAIISANGLDAYFFVRFLRIMAYTFLPIWLITWVVLMPVDSVKTGVLGNSGLDFFTFGNVATDNQVRYAAHLILVYFSTCEFYQLYCIPSLRLYSSTYSLDPL